MSPEGLVRITGRPGREIRVGLPDDGTLIPSSLVSAGCHPACGLALPALSYRDVEDLLAERGFDVSYETVRSWVLKFGPVIARRLRRRRPRPSDRWHLEGVSRTHF